MLPLQRVLGSLISNPAGMLAHLPVWDALRPLRDRDCMRLEAVQEQGWFQVRAEIPGVDPPGDVQIAVSDGKLMISAVRRRKVGVTRRSEFRYGSFARAVPLPSDANALDITTTYNEGILTVFVPLSETAPAVGQRVTLPVTY